MGKKKLVKAITLGTVGVTALTPTIGSMGNVFAEEAQIMQGEDELNFDFNNLELDKNYTEGSAPDGTQSVRGYTTGNARGAVGVAGVSHSSLVSLEGNRHIMGTTAFYKDLKAKVAVNSLVELNPVVKIYLMSGPDTAIAVKDITGLVGEAVFDITDQAKGIRYEYKDGSVHDESIFDKIQELAGVTAFSKDVSAPTFSLNRFTGTTVVGDNSKNYVTQDGNLVFSLADAEAGINQNLIKVTATGMGSIGYTYDSASSELTIATQQFKTEGSTTLSFEYGDMVGNASTSTYDLNTMRETPTLNGKSHSAVYTTGSTSYISSKVDVEVKTDNDAIVRSIQLLRDGAVYKQFNNKGVASITDNGVYSILVTDISGNTRVYTMEDLFTNLKSDIKVDADKPSSTVRVNNSPISATKSLKIGDEASLNIDALDALGIVSMNISVNNLVSWDEACNGLTAMHVDRDLKSLGTPDNGVYHVILSITDKVGNVSVSQVDVLADFDAPTLTGGVKTGSFNVLDNVGYVKDDVVISGVTADVGSGIAYSKVLIDGVDSGKTLPFTIEDSGEYSIEVSDVAGNITKHKLTDFVPDIGVNKFVVDKSAPKITEVAGFKPDLVKETINWYSKEPTLVYSVVDTDISSVSVKVNGDEKVAKLSTDNTYSIDTKGYAGNVTVEASSIDKAGNTSTKSFSYTVDKESPVGLTAITSVPYNARNGKIYFSAVPTVSLSANDGVGVGVNQYFLSGDKLDKNQVGTFGLADGKYQVEVDDLLGNKSAKVDLGSLLGSKSNVIKVDSEAPKIDCKRPAGDINAWFNKNVTYGVKLSDNEGINNAKVSINGTIVDSFTTDKAEIKNADLKGDTSKVQAKDGGMYTITVDIEDNAGNTSQWSDTIYIDTSAPVIEKFVFTGDGVSEGNPIKGSDRFGFFFKGEAQCEVYVGDGLVSSGLDKVYATLEDNEGKTKDVEAEIKAGVAKFTISDGFKGFVTAYATDKVQNKGELEKPDGVITEDSNWHINNTKIDILLPETKRADNSGVPLYKSDVDATAKVSCHVSGLRQIEWGVNSGTVGTVAVDLDGNITGDTASIDKKGKNLVVDLTNALAIKGNTNSMSIWVRITDRVGHVSESSKVISIDKDVPVIGVTYDTKEANNQYNRNRTANITIDERNFSPNDVAISGKAGTLGNWVYADGLWKNTMVFNTDDVYKWQLDFTDLAGNTAVAYASEEFVIDKTAPVLRVTYNNNDVESGSFYKNARTATITVTDRNFDANLLVHNGSGEVGKWSSNGDVHTAPIVFNQDGEYEFAVKITDKAGNASEGYESGKFVIDQTVPIMIINGVEDGISYKKDQMFTVKLLDTYLDTSRTSVTLKGRENGSIPVKGTLNEKTGEYVFPSFGDGAKSDDRYTLEAVATDKAGNRVSKTLVFSINKTGSKYKFGEAELLGNYLKKARDVKIYEDNVDKLDISKAKVVVLRDGKSIPVNKDLITIAETGGSAGKFNYLYTISSKVFNKDGKYQVQVYSQAIEGTQYSSVSQEYAFVLDSEKPEIIISGVRSGNSYNGVSKRVTIDVRDTSGVGKLSVLVNGKDTKYTKENGVYTLALQESKDAYNIEVTVTDKAGNTASNSVSDVIVTSSSITHIANQGWFKWGIAAGLAFLAALIALILKSRRSSRRDEEESLREHEEMYIASSTGGNSASVGSASSKDMVEDFEKEELDDDVTSEVDEEDTGFTD